MNIDSVGANAGNDIKAPVRQPGDSNRMWSIEELIAFLGVSRETFRSWRKHGRGHAHEFRFGKVLRFTEQDVAEWVAAGCGAKEPRREPVDVNELYGWSA